jgi:trigger factor
MQVTIETTGALERKMTVQLPVEDFQQEVQKRLQDTARRVRLPGFRPGRVPMKEVQRRFGAGVRQEVAGELMQRTVFQAMAQESLRPAGQPNLDWVSEHDDSQFAYAATFEVFPEINLSDLGDCTVEQPEADVTEGDIDTMIERLREQRKTFVESEGRAAEEGDEITVDFTGYLGEEAFEGGAAEDAKIVIGSGRMIPGFEEGLKGLKAGEEKRLAVTFPEDYGNEALKGQAAEFAITVKSVAQAELPALDEAFFTQFGVEDGELDSFRAEVRSNMERELRNAVRTRVKNQVMDALADKHEVALPHAMVHEEIHRMQHDMARQFGGQGMDPHQLPAELFRAQAERRVKLGLLMAHIVDTEALTADEARVEAMLEDIAAPYDEPEQVKSWYHGNEEQMNQLRNAAVEDQVIDWLLEKMAVSTVTLSYEDAIAAAQQQGSAAVEEDTAEDGAEG